MTELVGQVNSYSEPFKTLLRPDDAKVIVDKLTMIDMLLGV